MVEERTLQEGRSDPLNESDIMDKVLGIRCGHKRGRGRKVPNEGAPTSKVQSKGARRYTLEEVNEMFNTQQNFNKVQVDYLTSIHAALQVAKIKVPKFPIIRNPAMVEEEEEDDEDDEEDEGEDDYEDEE